MNKDRVQQELDELEFLKTNKSSIENFKDALRKLNVKSFGDMTIASFFSKKKTYKWKTVSYLQAISSVLVKDFNLSYNINFFQQSNIAKMAASQVIVPDILSGKKEELQALVDAASKMAPKSLIGHTLEATLLYLTDKKLSDKVLRDVADVLWDGSGKWQERFFDASDLERDKRVIAFVELINAFKSKSDLVKATKEYMDKAPSSKRKM